MGVMNKSDRDETIAHLVEKGVAPRTVADALGVHLSTVYRAIKATRVQEDDMTETPMSSADKIRARFLPTQEQLEARAEREESNLAKVRRMEAEIYNRTAELKAAGIQHQAALKQASEEYRARVDKASREEAKRDEAAFLRHQAYLDSDAGQLEELEAHLETQEVPMSSAQRLRKSYLERRVNRSSVRVAPDQI